MEQFLNSKSAKYRLFGAIKLNDNKIT